MANKDARDTGYELETNHKTGKLDSTLPLIKTHAIIFSDPDTRTQVKIQAWFHGDEKKVKDISVDGKKHVCDNFLTQLLIRLNDPGRSGANVHCDRLQETRGVKADNQIHMIFERH